MPDGSICTLVQFTVACFSIVVVQCNFRTEASQEDALHALSIPLRPLTYCK
jgi:hypothetical protein